MPTIFTGGLFSFKNGNLQFYCRNKDKHREEISMERSFTFKNFYDHTKNDDSYMTDGIMCYCGKNDTNILLEPDRVRALQHMCALGSTEEEVSFYLRAWSNFQLPMTDYHENTKWSEYEYMEITDVQAVDGFYRTKEQFIGSKIFCYKKDLEKISGGNRSYRLSGNLISNRYRIEEAKYDFKTINSICAYCFIVKPVGTSSTLFLDM